jgi:hypothetical protein
MGGEVCGSCTNSEDILIKVIVTGRTGFIGLHCSSQLPTKAMRFILFSYLRILISRLTRQDLDPILDFATHYRNPIIDSQTVILNATRENNRSSLKRVENKCVD